MDEEFKVYTTKIKLHKTFCDYIYNSDFSCIFSSLTEYSYVTSKQSIAVHLLDLSHDMHRTFAVPYDWRPTFVSKIITFHETQGQTTKSESHCALLNSFNQK